MLDGMVDGAGERRDVAVYIVTIGVPTSEFSARLESLAGARLIRELPPGRVVVALATHGDLPRLAALPGVTAVLSDKPEHPDRQR
jgi:hypothetical protein